MQRTDDHLETAEVSVDRKTVDGRTVRYYHHSQSPAMWVGVIMAAIGFLLAAVGSVLGPNWMLIWVGGAVVLGSLIVTNILKAMGLGHG